MKHRYFKQQKRKFNMKRKTCMLEIRAGSTVIASESRLDKVSLDACHGSVISDSGCRSADSIPFPSMSRSRRACISRTKALTSCPAVPSSNRHFILSKLYAITKKSDNLLKNYRTINFNRRKLIRIDQIPNYHGANKQLSAKYPDPNE